MQPNRWARYGQKAAFIFAPLLVLPLLLVFVSVARAQPQDFNCADFPSQAVAQRAVQQDPSDPFNLDADDDGQACEDFDYDGNRAGGGTIGDNQVGDNQFRENTAIARGAAHDQYTGEQRVIKQTIPNKGNLGKTGGPPLLLLAAGGVLLSIGVLLSFYVLPLILRRARL